MTYRFQFSVEEDEKLIECIANCPALYDTGHELYKNRLMRETIWTQISEEVQRSTSHCRKRWRNIKDTYVKHRRNKLPTDSAAQQKPKWALLAHLSFLDDIFDEQSTPSNISAQNPVVENKVRNDEDISGDIRFLDDSNDSMQTSAQGVIQDVAKNIPGTTSKRIRKRKYVDVKVLEMLQQRSCELKNILQCMNKSNDTDPLLLFFKSMTMTVKSFEPQLIVEAKSRIFKIVNELEVRALQSQQGFVPPKCDI